MTTLTDLFASLSKGPAAVAQALTSTEWPVVIQHDLVRQAWAQGHADIARQLEAHLAQQAAPESFALPALLGVIAGPCLDALPAHWAAFEPRPSASAENEDNNSYAWHPVMEHLVEQASPAMRTAALDLARTTVPESGWIHTMNHAMAYHHLEAAETLLAQAPSAMKENLEREAMVMAIRHRRLGWVITHLDRVTWTGRTLEMALTDAMEQRQETMVQWVLATSPSTLRVPEALHAAVDVQRLDWVNAILDRGVDPGTVAEGVKMVLARGGAARPLLEALLPHTTLDAVVDWLGDNPLAYLVDQQGDVPGNAPLAQCLAPWLRAISADTLEQSMSRLRTRQDVHAYGACLETLGTEHGYFLGVDTLLARMNAVVVTLPNGPWQTDPEGFQTKLLQWLPHCSPDRMDRAGTDANRIRAILFERYSDLRPEVQQALVAHWGPSDRPAWHAVARHMLLANRPPQPTHRRPRA